MASRRYALLAAILITIFLDVSSIVATAAAVAWNPKISRYIGSYNLDKGPVFYEAYYPDSRDAYQEKRYFGRNTVLETSFQVPLERFAEYSAERERTAADHPISINESFVVVDNEETLPREQRKARVSRRTYDARTTSQLAPFSNKRSTIFDDDKNSQVANIEEISKLVKRAISRDLETWNALEGYLDRTIHQDRPQLGMYSREIHKNREGDGFVSKLFPGNRGPKDLSERPSIFEASPSLPGKLDAHDEKQGPIYANENAMTSETRVSGTQAVDTSPPIDVISDSSSPENIFQPRPQLIKYMFFKRPGPPRIDKQNEKTIDESTPRTSGDNLMREEIVDNNGRRVEENVKVTSIEISDVPRHKTRHHHGEWPKRDYSIHRHHSRPAYPTVS
ncbi:uncharacterized protein LOC112453329 [Temnothorax curvispinosus]|uniref:Uncharacterized protein LOC112453329 n=1 Tax=Temnothorax curvispinosus TaxID=300111 RepID=A0A6J1PJJ3_9HYME|nr:uncharacterized protein LOC112453329 [Temnothorax curvispinosus]